MPKLNETQKKRETKRETKRQTENSQNKPAFKGKAEANELLAIPAELGGLRVDKYDRETERERQTEKIHKHKPAFESKAEAGELFPIPAEHGGL